VAFAQALVAHVTQYGVHVVVPATDASMTAVLEICGETVGGAVVAGPSPDAFRQASDKASLVRHAEGAGLAVPRSRIAAGPDDLLDAVRSIGYPCVLKPHRSLVLEQGIGRSYGVRRVVADRDLSPPYPTAAFPVIVQEWVPGAGEGLFALVGNGRLIATFAHRRIREKPPGGGVSVYREAIAVPEDTRAAAEALLSHVGWQGAAMVEFRRTPAEGRATGTPYLMEVNGRLWGSLQLAIDAGVDFPVMLVDLALGRPVASVTHHRVGIRSRWFWGDVDHLLARFRRDRVTLGLPPDAPSRLRACIEFLTIRRCDRLEVFDPEDMGPFLRETLQWFRGGST
jgi:predicted ATP-grasp superfamily ATP-dependent carboligase